MIYSMPASRPTTERCPQMTKPSTLFVATGVFNRLFWLFPIVCAVLIGAFGASVSRAQVAVHDEVKSGPTASDYAAVGEATIVYRHARPANTAAGAGMKQKEIASTGGSSGARSAAGSAGATTTTADDDQLRFPGDLIYNGGRVLRTSESHSIFLLPNGVCPIATCWGNPE